MFVVLDHSWSSWSLRIFTGKWLESPRSLWFSWLPKVTDIRILEWWCLQYTSRVPDLDVFAVYIYIYIYTYTVYNIMIEHNLFTLCTAWFLHISALMHQGPMVFAGEFHHPASKRRKLSGAAASLWLHPTGASLLGWCVTGLTYLLGMLRND